MPNLSALFFAPLLFLYSVLKEFEATRMVDRIENFGDKCQVELFSLLGYNLSFRVFEAGCVLITEASSGVGGHCCFELVEKGFTVFAGVRKLEGTRAGSHVSRRS